MRDTPTQTFSEFAFNQDQDAATSDHKATLVTARRPPLIVSICTSWLSDCLMPPATANTSVHPSWWPSNLLPANEANIIDHLAQLPTHLLQVTAHVRLFWMPSCQLPLISTVHHLMLNTFQCVGEVSLCPVMISQLPPHLSSCLPHNCIQLTLCLVF